MIELRYPLYKHQEEAFKKLKGLTVGALTMDMGTGKTRTMLELIKDKVDRSKVDKVLWFCPYSAKVNIKKELEKQLISGHDLFIIAGIESMSSSISLNSYLYNFVRKYRTLIVVDESTKIKNINTKRAERIIGLGQQCKYKYILTGNPIPRDELDLFGQFYFLDWRILGYKSQWSFHRNHAVYDDEIYTRIIDTKNTEYLANRIAPYSYQVKIDQCVDLPGKVHSSVYFDMDHDQYNLYCDLGAYLVERIDEWSPGTIYRLFSILQGVTAGFIYTRDEDEITRIGYRDNPDSNPRLKALLDLVEDTTGKVIIFCEYQEEVKTIVRLLNQTYGKESAVPFDGAISIKQRNENIEKFRGPARFLVANKDCAGYSLNLQFCNKTIYYNNDWDFGTREQSEDRTYRIGQDKKCLYVDIICDRSIEDHIIDCLKRKSDLGRGFMRKIESTKDEDRKSFIKNLVGISKAKKKDMEDTVLRLGDDDGKEV